MVSVLALPGNCVIYLYSEVLIKRTEEQQEKKENDKSKKKKNKIQKTI